MQASWSVLIMFLRGLVVNSIKIEINNIKRCFGNLAEFELETAPKSVIDELKHTFSTIYVWENDFPIPFGNEKLHAVVWVLCLDQDKMVEILNIRDVKHRHLIVEKFQIFEFFHAKLPFRLRSGRKDCHCYDSDLLPDLSFSGLVKFDPFGLADSRFSRTFKIPSYLKSSGFTVLTGFLKKDL